jgi:hypothetical protein
MVRVVADERCYAAKVEHRSPLHVNSLEDPYQKRDVEAREEQ